MELNGLLIRPSPELRIGAIILVTEPTGQLAKLYRYEGAEAGFEEIDLTPKAQEALMLIRENL